MLLSFERVLPYQPSSRRTHRLRLTGHLSTIFAHFVQRFHYAFVHLLHLAGHMA
jgi:hypothetical protein